jgi:endonuclease/exonuclease/phosphatase family metal-dependent hydrolase
MEILFILFTLFFLILSILFYQQEIYLKDLKYMYTTTNANEISTMTYNIRAQDLDWGRHHWKVRLSLLVIRISQHNPDIIGTQEGLYSQLKVLEGSLTSYNAFAYVEGNLEQGLESNVIFYKRDKFEFVEGNYLWLSDDPKIALSNTWGARLPRTFTYLVLRIKETREEILVINTHLDHHGKTARFKSAEFIVKFVKEFNINSLPVIILGDFNQNNHSVVYQIFMEDGFKDPFDNCTNNCILGNHDKASFHYYYGKLINYPIINILSYFIFSYEVESIAIYKRFHIDWILYKNTEKSQLTPTYVHLCIDSENYIDILRDLMLDITNFYQILRRSFTFPSDHYPIITVFKLN